MIETTSYYKEIVAQFAVTYRHELEGSKQLSYIQLVLREGGREADMNSYLQCGRTVNCLIEVTF
jgi:hypothetical protein